MPSPPFTFQLVESEEVDSSQVSAGACGGPTSKDTREVSRGANYEGPSVWDESRACADVVAGIQRDPLSAKVAARMGTS